MSLIAPAAAAAAWLPASHRRARLDVCASAAFNLWLYCNAFLENSCPPSCAPLPSNPPLVPRATAAPLADPSLFRPLGIYIIVLPGSPLNRVAGRDSAGASFRVDVDGRAPVISPIKRSRCNVHSVRYLRIYRDPSVTLLPLLLDHARGIPSIFAREILLYSDCFSARA